jgi:putative oxidoreductase
MDFDRWILGARLCLAAVFLYSGVDKLIGWPGAVAEAAALGLPWPAVAMALTIAAQLAGGLSVLFGMYARAGAALLLAFTVAATLFAHWPGGLAAEELRRQLTVSLEHLAIVGGFIALLAVGPGEISMDAWRLRRMKSGAFLSASHRG